MIAAALRVVYAVRGKKGTNVMAEKLIYCPVLSIVLPTSASRFQWNPLVDCGDDCAVELVNATEETVQVLCECLHSVQGIAHHVKVLNRQHETNHQQLCCNQTYHIIIINVAGA